MGKGIPVQKLLKPLDEVTTQCYLGTGLHTLGLLGWILEQTGCADVTVSTFSTSDAFLSGFLRLRQIGKIGGAILVADLKASRKTLQLCRLMHSCFDRVCLAQNHSKIMLVCNAHYTVSVITSQNQTYGDRAECTMVTTDTETYLQLQDGISNIINQSIHLDELLERLSGQTGGDGD